MKVGDLVKDKRGEWDVPRLLIEMDPAAQSMVTVFGNGTITYIHNYNIEVVNEMGS